MGDVCLTVASYDCFELRGKLSVNGTVVFEQNVPLPTLVRQAKYRLEHPPAGTPKNVACLNLTTPLGSLVGVQVCANVSEMKIDGDDFKFCGSFAFNLTTPLGNFNRTFDVPCIDISDCKIFGCPNNCSHHGQCNSVGLCDCASGYEGLDCSVFFNGTCVANDIVPNTCWRTFFPDCKTVEFEVTSGGREVVKFKKSLSETKTLDLMPCEKIPGNTACEMCVVASNISVQGDKLMGAPAIQVKCSGIVVDEFPWQMTVLGQSPALVCGASTPSGNSPTDTIAPASSLGVGRVLMWVAVAVLAVALLAGGGYFVYVRYAKRNEFGSYGYDVVQLSRDDVDDDDAPLKSPFGGSSDDE